MNDHVFCAKIHLEHEASPATTALKLNSTPMGTLDYRYPKEALVMQADMPEVAKDAGGIIIPFPRKS